jgi:hypothetical protein
VRRSTATLVLLAALTVACDPGANPVVAGGPSGPTASTSTRPPPAPPTWTGTIVSRSDHRLYVGGTCSTDWRTTLSFTVDGTAAGGTGVAILTSKGSPCPFPVAQIQIRRFELAVTGDLRSGVPELRISDVRHTPSAGADDLGGFRSTTLSRSLQLKVDSGGVRDRLTLQATDHDRGAYTSVNVIELRCKGC